MIPSSLRNVTFNLAPMREAARRMVDSEHYQPQDQDGATAESRGRLADLSSRRRRLLAGEPEDARLTGGTRSLMRRLAGLNIPMKHNSATPPVPQAPKARLITA